MTVAHDESSAAGTQEAARPVRDLVLILGDQLDAEALTVQQMDAERDCILMLELRGEATYIPQHKHRLVVFFSAMRHFAAELRASGLRVAYAALDDPQNRGNLGAELGRWIACLQPARLLITQPGDFRALAEVRAAAKRWGGAFEVVTDRHFYDTPEEFSQFAKGRRGLRLEHYYRHLRKRHDVLMDGTQPVTGKWNYDAANRKSFGRKGPGWLPAAPVFAPDDETRRVMELVEREFPQAPGDVSNFDHPVTADQAESALTDFVSVRLPAFGDFQDAMARGHMTLYHSRLSSVMNLHLLSPRRAVDAAVAAYQNGHAPLNAVEGFVRQIVGWREFLRGVYWTHMPNYANANALGATADVPAALWTAETDMVCLREAVSHLKQSAYTHHIHRLMVLGLFAMQFGVHPYALHEWHMAMYIDAVDWVSLPNVLGMSQHADGGLVGSKPYCASGRYIERMSDYCGNCRYAPAKAYGDDACPITTLYWDFLMRHEERFAGNHRMGFQLKNLRGKSPSERRSIASAAAGVHNSFS